MNGARFALSVDRLSDSDRAFEDTNLCSLDPTVNPALKRLGCVIGELIETEKNYVQSLFDVDQGYLAQLLQDPDVESSVLDTVFGRIGDLRIFHEHLLLNLQLHREDLVQLARVFLNNAKQFEHLYVEFCINYSKSIHTLQDAKQNRTSLWNKLTTCQRNLGHQLPVETYLLKPVQRVLKYQLLLQECVKHCMSAIHALNRSGEAPTDTNRAVPSSHGLDLTDSRISLLHHLNEAVPVLGQALERMIKVADHINEKKRCRELIDQLRTMRIDVDDWGELVLRGYFRVPGKKDLRLVLLFHRAILLCKNSGSTQSGQSGTFSASGSADQLWSASTFTIHNTEFGFSNSSLPNLGGHASGSRTVQIREIINCANLMLVECIPKDALAFHILPFDNPKAQRTLQAPTLEMKRLWCREIKRLILENYDAAIPEKAKHIVLNMAELSTARGMLNPSCTGVHNFTEPNQSFENKPPVRSFSVIPSRSQTLEWANTTEKARPSTGSAYRSQTDHRKQRHSETTIPDYVTLKQSGAYSLFSAQSSLQESPRRKLSSQSTTVKSPDNIGDVTDGLDAVFHDVWNKVWSKHAGASNQIHVSTTTSDSPEQPNPTSVTSSKAPVFSDTDTDFRCIAVEINEERLGVEISSEVPRSLSPDKAKESTREAPSPERNERRKISSSRHHKAPAPRPPESPRNNLSPNLGKPDSPSYGGKCAQASSFYIDCPNASCYDVITFGRAYEHYIAKARAQVALSPRDLDEIFSPLRELAQTDVLGQTIRAATVPLSGNVEVTELKHRLNSQRAATTERDPFFYRQTSPAQSRNFALNPSLFRGEAVVSITSDNSDHVENDVVNDIIEGTNSRGSSGASSPRHLVSRIAFSSSRNSLPADKLTKTIVVQPPSNEYHSRGNDAKLISDSTGPDPTTYGLLLQANKSPLNRNDDHTAATQISTAHDQILKKISKRRGSCDSHDVQGNAGGIPNGLKHSAVVPSQFNERRSDSNQVHRSTFVKRRSLSTVKQTPRLDLSRVKSALSCSQPPSPIKTSASHPTGHRLIGDSVTSRSNHRKVRAAPPPPPSTIAVVSAGTSFLERAPLAQEESAKDLETNGSAVASVYHGQPKQTVASTVDALPYVDDTSSSASSVLASSSARFDVSALKSQPAKPPRRITIATGTSSCSQPPFESTRIHSKENNVSGPSNNSNINNGKHIHNASRSSVTNGLSLPSSGTSSPSRAGLALRKGTVRTMIDRFQR